MKTVSKAQKNKEKLITVKELGAFLGISSSSVYRLVERREIPFFKLRSGLRFRVDDVDAYLEACRIEAISNNQTTYGSTNH